MNRQEKTEELYKFHEWKFDIIGEENPLFIPKCAYPPKGMSELHIGFFQSEVKKGKDPKTGADIIASVAEYYVYSDRGTAAQSYGASINAGLRIAADAIINVNSGLMDAKNTFVISYLHKAIKPLNFNLFKPTLHATPITDQLILHTKFAPHCMR